MSSWSLAGASLTGLAAADSVCVAEATSAGLSNPENFVAWLSDDTDDAYCRVQGLSGKRADNCGESERPDDAGPWVRTDGVALANSLDMMIETVITYYTPLLLDATGSNIDPDERAWSSSSPSGTLYGPGNCAGWTSTEGIGSLKDLAASLWIPFTAQGCSSPARLMCIEKGSLAALNISEPNSNIAFVTETRGTGDMGSWDAATADTKGLEAADSICNNLAGQAGLPWVGTYKAWLSDGSIDAIDRLTGTGSWQRPDGITVARDRSDFTSGSLFAAINYSDGGIYHYNVGVWTGTLEDGSDDANHCNGWTSQGAENGRGGRAMWSNADWTDRDTSTCSDEKHLYCLSNVVRLIHSDGFEAEN